MAAHENCNDQAFRLSVYEAGHAITAYLLGHKIISIQLLPRPPMLVAEKTFANLSWNSFIGTLESRMMELFGGQIAEEIICEHSSCCAGDISRIDEISRILFALYSDDDIDLESSEDVLFEFEERTQEMFASQGVREAILPVAEYIYAQEEAGQIEIDGAAVIQEIEKYLPRPEKENSGFFGFLKRA